MSETYVRPAPYIEERSEQLLKTVFGDPNAERRQGESLEDFNLLDVDYEFQTILEDDVFEEIVYETSGLEDNCQFFVQSGSFKSQQAAESQVLQLQKINYEAKVENVNSVNNFNYIVVVGPFKNRSQTNNAREDFRRHSLLSINCKAVVCGLGLDSYKAALAVL